MTEKPIDDLRKMVETAELNARLLEAKVRQHVAQAEMQKLKKRGEPAS